MNRDERSLSRRLENGPGLPDRQRRLAARDSLRARVRSVIFESETPAGRRFDILLIVAILVSVSVVFLDSVPGLQERWGALFYSIEWGFTLLFTFEYMIRLWCIERPGLYARSFYGIVDLLGVLPTYLSLVFVDTQYMTVIRILRVLRVFRVLRMVRWVGEASYLLEAMQASRRKIMVFLFAILMMVTVFGSLLYVIEGPKAGYTSIPASIYWAIVTLTTVGYGDIVPATALGKVLASVIMISGYAIIAVPTGIVTVELNQAMQRQANTRTCPVCSAEGHSQQANYCWRCGSALYATGSAPKQPKQPKQPDRSATESEESGE